jgi:hypothetical protein
MNYKLNIPRRLKKKLTKIALRFENGLSIINGESKIEHSGIFKAAGTDIFYYRRRIILGQDVGEGFFIKGPISEPIILQVSIIVLNFITEKISTQINES